MAGPDLNRPTMRILHLSDALHPPVIGGTEVFIDRLLAAQGRLPQPLQVLWAAHADPGSEASAAAPGAGRLLLPPVPSADRCRRLAMEAAALPGFAALLDDFLPQVLHLHSWSERCGLSHVLATQTPSSRAIGGRNSGKAGSRWSWLPAQRWQPWESTTPRPRRMGPRA